jgi:hypothetical protein
VAYIAAGILLAACGSEVPPEEFIGAQGGLVAANGGSIAVDPSGAAPSEAGPSGTSTSGAGIATAAVSVGGNVPGGGAPGHDASPGASTPVSGTSRRSHPAPTHGAGSSRSSSAPPTQTCTRTSTTPSVKVCPHTGVHDGQTVTVEGWGFKPNTQLAVAECRDRGDDTNLSDCNIDSVISYSPSAKVTADANGHIGPLRIVVKKTFKGVNCGAESCLVAVSEPTLNPDPSDEGDVRLHFV